MQLHYADTHEGYAAWLALWQRSPEREPFAHPGYALLYAGDASRACAAAMEQEGGTVLYPFLLRDLRMEPFWPQQMQHRPAYDIVTPYGYGGAEWLPKVESLKPKVESQKRFRAFYNAFAEWAAATGVVSEFVRFSLFSEARHGYDGLVEHNNDNIVCETGPHGDGLHDRARYKVRKNVRTAEACGLTVEDDEAGKRLDDFLAVYHDTMDRRNAAPFYYFGKPYLVALMQALGKQCRFFHVVHEDQVVATELVLCSANRVYSFLGGTLTPFFKHRASDLLKAHLMQWTAQAGYRQFVIGGGYKPHDGIFAFKKGFAPAGVVPFYTGKKVFDKNMYHLLASTDKPGQGFFPAYRRVAG